MDSTDNKLKIKLCGFADKATLNLAANLGVDFVGLVFHANSPRAIIPNQAAQIISDLPNKVKKVAVQ